MSGPSRLHSFRPWLSSIGIIAAMLQWRVTGAAAQMVAESMAPASPDWSSAHTLLSLLFFLPTLPVYIGVIALLYRRRRLYPIAGRGAFFILVCGVNSLVGGAISCLLMIAYPRGVPCGMYVLLLWMFLPLVFSMLVRCYLLIFRLEIQNYLTELAWRQNKMARLRERGLFKETEEAKGDGGADATSPADSSAAPAAAAARRYAAPSDPLAPPSFDPPSIPGHAFITRRWLTEPRWVLLGVGLACLFSVILIILVSVFDHDVQLTDEWRRARGLPDDGFSSQFDPFLKGPRCFPYSIKNGVFLSLIVVAVPLVISFAWRIRLHTKRTTQRALQQTAFDDAMRQQIQVRSETVDHDDSASGAHDHEHDHDHTAKEMDELSSVKIELLSISLLGSVGTIMATAELSFAYEWLNLHILLTHLLAFCIVCVPPLYFSYVIQRRHRQLMQRTRQNSQSGAAGGGREGRLIALVPHHRPLYRLKHLLHDPHAFPVLLKFLQKEFSSENALFYIESRRFGAFCRNLERAVPGWTSHLDDDSASGSGPSGEAWSTNSHVTSGGGGGGGLGGVGDALMLTPLERFGTGDQADTKRSPLSLAVPSPPTSDRTSALTVLVGSRAVSATQVSVSGSPVEMGNTPCATAGAGQQHSQQQQQQQQQQRRTGTPSKRATGEDPAASPEAFPAAAAAGTSGARVSSAAVSKRTPIHIRVDWPQGSEAQSGGSLRLPGATPSGSAEDRSTPVPSKRMPHSRASSNPPPMSPSLLPVPSPPPAAARIGSGAAQRPAAPCLRQLHMQAGRSCARLGVAAARRLHPGQRRLPGQHCQRHRSHAGRADTTAAAVAAHAARLGGRASTGTATPLPVRRSLPALRPIPHQAVAPLERRRRRSQTPHCACFCRGRRRNLYRTCISVGRRSVV